MHNLLFWLSALLTIGVFALTLGMRAWQAHPGADSPAAPSAPEK